MFKVKMRLEIYEDEQYMPLYEEVEVVGEAQTYSAAKVLINLLGEKELIRLIKNEKKEKPKG